MTKRHLRTIILSILILALGTPLPVSGHPHIISTKHGNEIGPDELLADLRQVQVIFVGEFHDHRGHHRMQLDIIDALDDDPTPLAVGLEMFRHDSQEALDRWVNNELPISRFLESFRDNWSMWPLYQDIFVHAHRNRVKLVGLNIPRSITGKVAQDGFNALSEKDRQLLGNVQCIVDKEYGSFIRQAMGGFGGHGDTFLHFCEAQVLWDTMMARHLLDFIEANPDYRVVVLAGSGHAWKYGIPRQMIKEADIEYRVILPEMFERADRVNVTSEIADYLWLDVDANGWRLE